ncbi:GNAT family N-acetyltransferase, partial [Coprobacillus cateniformis]|nr:GNAT family N-acetyltransferase [Coprobacillus cateniformis]
MNIKKSSVNDVQAIMKLVHQAQLYFKNNGIDQWQDGYPKDENIYSDIDKGHS